MLAHFVKLGVKFFLENAQFVLELGTEGFKRVIYSFGFSLSEVTVGLDFALDVLKLSL